MITAHSSVWKIGYYLCFWKSVLWDPAQLHSLTSAPNVTTILNYVVYSLVFCKVYHRYVYINLCRGYTCIYLYKYLSQFCFLLLNFELYISKKSKCIILQLDVFTCIVFESVLCNSLLYNTLFQECIPIYFFYSTIDGHLDWLAVTKSIAIIFLV